jgi:lipopolysaccharide assembly protein B
MDGVLNWLPWLFIAAVLFFALGWVGARVDAKRLLNESRALPQAYFKGVNFLLNEEPDKAIDALIEASKQHPEAIELQFALGSLFRRRGEIDRALRVHKNLSEQSGLSSTERAAALYETALDYHKSGLLDYAEKTLCDLIDKRSGSDTQQRQIQTLLLNLYEQERAWRKAIDIARMLDSDVPQDRRQYVREVANFYCELAADYQAANNLTEAFAQLDRALAENPKCVRANMLRGDWLMHVSKHEEAIAAWQKIEAQDPAFLGLSAEATLNAYAAISKTDVGLVAITALHQRYPALDLLNALFKATLASHGPEAAYALVKDDLQINPTLVGLDRLLEAEILAATDDKKEQLTIEREIVHSHASRLAVYLCKRCGFKAKQFYWHCPACGGWESFPPRRTAEYDTAERHLSRLQVEHINNQ